MSGMQAPTAAVLSGNHPECLPSSCPQTLVGHQKRSADRAMTTVHQMCEFGGFVFSMNWSLMLDLDIKLKQDKKKRVKFILFPPPNSLLAPLWEGL